LGSSPAVSRLRDVASRDRLAEMTFELPLAGGDHPGESAATLTRVAELLRRRLPADDPFAAYPDRLSGPGLEHRQLRGYLAGSLDAVLRLGEHRPRFVVVDYKTNWLGGATGEPLTAWHLPAGGAGAGDAGGALPATAVAVPGGAALDTCAGGSPRTTRTETSVGVCTSSCAACAVRARRRWTGLPCGVFGWVPPPGLVRRAVDAARRGAG
jgi:exodeoxyribonuclease V beta subunit